MLKAVVIGCAAAAAVLVTAPSASATPAPINYHSSSCPTSLTDGEDDGCVVFLQQTLNTLGFGLSVDGQFGGNTLAAVKWAQTKAHLQDSSVGVDGQVGPVTKAWLDKFYEQTSLQPGPSNACSISLNPSPGSSAASATIAQINNSASCTGWLERSDNGGASWYQVSGQHTIGGPGQWVTTYDYSDSSTQLAKACVHYVGSGQNGTTCTIGF
ncbi:putative peptidoglycan binding protein [Streptomyces sp. 846.5]|nr:peptidoglycan-binding domain-containing protein [Streptomyces sp. 846.5]TDT97542.1 putative peptidoglycan binding protein [Streptomyces sp. 846.5]